MVGLVGRVVCARDVRDALVRLGSSGASGARGTCRTQRDARRMLPVEKELGVCCRGSMVAISVSAPGPVRGRGDDDDRSCDNSGDGKSRLEGKMLVVILICIDC